MTTVPQVQITARDYLLSKGEPPISLNGSIALVSVLYRESRLSPASQGVQPTEHGGILNPRGAVGVASWNGPEDQSKIGDPVYDRQARLDNYAKAHGLAVFNLETQLAFVLNEIANYYLNCWAAIRSTASYESIITVLVDEYEIPANKTAEINAALAFARPLAALPPPQPTPAAPPSQLVPGVVPKPAAAITPVPQVSAPKVPVPSTPPSAAPAGLPSISATSAGRIAAQINTLTAMREARIAELIAADPEIAAYDAGLAVFTKLGSASALPTLPAPPAIPPVDQATTTGNTQMSAIFTTILTNWATSALGTVAGGPSVIDVIQNPANWQHDLPGIATVLLGLVAKDGWVTGGTKQAPVSK